MTNNKPRIASLDVDLADHQKNAFAPGRTAAFSIQIFSGLTMVHKPFGGLAPRSHLHGLIEKLYGSHLHCCLCTCRG